MMTKQGQETMAANSAEHPAPYGAASLFPLPFLASSSAR